MNANVHAMNGKIRVLVVDDSAFMRKALSMMLLKDPEIEVVGTARNGEDGLEKIRQLRPDVVTLDIEMPRMDGLTALKIIMKEMPLPVLMVSSLTTEGAESTLEALDIGAVDFIPKGLSYVSLDIVKIEAILIEKVKGVAKNRRRTAFPSAPKRVHVPPSGWIKVSGPKEVVAIGTSTGGPPALQKVLPRIPADFPVGILIVQHMPPTFTKSLADRLNGQSAIHVKEAEEGDRVEPGVALLAPGDRHMIAQGRSGIRRIHLSEKPDDTLHRPSVDVMTLAVAEAYGGKSLGVILTGMGHDGLEGMGKMKQKGATILAQDEASCVVYGMPRSVVEAGLADKVLPLGEIARGIAQGIK